MLVHVVVLLCLDFVILGYEIARAVWAMHLCKEDVWPTYTPLSIASAGLATDPPSIHVQWPIGGCQGRHHLRQTN